MTFGVYPTRICIRVYAFRAARLHAGRTASSASNVALIGSGLLGGLFVQCARCVHTASVLLGAPLDAPLDAPRLNEIAPAARGFRTLGRCSGGLYGLSVLLVARLLS